jgi:SPP1 family predicted phage head-tail adaptor
MDVGKLRHKIDLWGMTEIENELLEIDFKEGKIKSIHAEIIPQTGSLSNRQGVDTILTNVTHKIIVRYNSGKDITESMWFIYRGHRFNIRFILNPYFSNEQLEIFCEEVKG